MLNKRGYCRLDKLKQKHEQRLNMAQVAQLGAQSSAEQAPWDDEEAGEGEAATPTAAAAESSGLARAQSPPPPAESDEAAPATSPKVTSITIAFHAAAVCHSAAGEVLKQAVGMQAEPARADDEPETSTASDDSSNAPWTVVTSPSHKRKGSDDSVTRPAPAERLEENAAPAAEVKRKEEASPKAETQASDEDDLTIDISDTEGAAPGEDESEVEEDWGLWD